MPRLSDCHYLVCLRTQRGFTLIELMIVVTLLGIFAAIAVPSFTQFINKSRTQSFNNELLSLLQYTRSTAVEQRTFLKVCKATIDSGDAWAVKKVCDDDDEDPLRTLDVPEKLQVTASVDEIAFRYNGTGTDAQLITCQGSDFANGFTIDIKASGSIQSWPRGKKETSTNMTACQ
ncbi:pilus assembly protein FimT [Pseudomonas daroniae]|uniref:Type II secretion system protein H n=1 Tax=Phytopseudomonas daroniae TaxID=2487519 RepID=A0A4Q9QMS8_9GAMM|nr:MULTISPECIES: GspH/FimT family pseudopilin [Pseudomonas]TBU81096.1 pilus assembly protein FimT [Pseudomonas daroniae]TBU83621.1 pilus assembly protein FimT [Pseudomonas sp. FRB 228]TBU86756.1 pilus assembly protein FimT [Pseudomonas daroniae]